MSRYLLMGYQIRPEDEHVAGLLLDMHRRGPTGRPSIESVRGHLESEYERRYGNDWQVDLDYSSEGFADSWDD
jgi:hypothetical protein